MSQLTELMEKGYRIQVSEHVSSAPGSFFGYTDPEHDWDREEPRTLVFHPLNYSYIAYNDPFKAHELNMARIYDQIEASYKKALKNIDDMVYEFEHKHDPRTIVFLYGTEVIENPDGSYTFFANGVPFEPAPEASVYSHEFLKEYQE